MPRSATAATGRSSSWRAACRPGRPSTATRAWPGSRRPPAPGPSWTATGTSLRAALVERPWLVKVNAAEAETVTGASARTRDRAAAAARDLRERGAANAIVTRGVHGAVLATADGAWALGNLPPAHRGPFSVGSGDAFLAGFLAGLARGLPPAEALALAGAAGAANARLAGQGELDPAEVERTRRVCEVVPL